MSYSELETFELKKDSMKLSMSSEQTVAGFWTKSEEVSKSQGSRWSSFSTKVTSRAEAKHLLYIEVFQTFEKELYHEICYVIWVEDLCDIGLIFVL